MKKIMILCLSFFAFTLTGCTGDNETYDILALTFPIYDWIDEIVGETDTNLTYDVLIDTGVDTHSYEPTFSEIIKIKSAKKIIVNCTEAEAFIYDHIVNTEVEVIALIDYLDQTDKIYHGGIDPTLVDPDCEESCCDHAYDEHVWLSLKSTMIFVEELTKVVVELDEENKTEYNENSTNYINKLSDLDDAYEAMVASATRDTVIFADRFPFIYLTNDYNINYYAAFDGCTTDVEISVAKLAELVDKTKEYNIANLLTIENYTHDVPSTVIKESGLTIEVLSLQSLQSVKRSEINNGLKYYDVMESNLEVFRKALS